MSQVRKKPDDSFVESESDQADNRKYQEFHLLACQSSSGEDPENAQGIIGHKSQDKGDGGRG